MTRSLAKPRILTAVIAVLAAATLSLGGCATSGGDTLEGSWVLSQASDSTGAFDLSTDGSAPTLEFDGEKFSGKAPCNNYFGTITGGIGTISFGEIGSTRMACTDDALTEIENRYLPALGEVTKAELSGGMLVLTGTDIELHFDSK